MLGAGFDIFNDLNTFFHHELEDFEMHGVHIIVFVPFFLHAVSLSKQILKPSFILFLPRLKGIYFLFHFVDFFVDNFHLDVWAAIFLNH